MQIFGTYEYKYYNRIVLDSSNYTSYTVKKDGTGASGTWGISISGNASTATKATQDASGNVITSKYMTIDTAQTISGAKTFSAAVIAKNQVNIRTSLTDHNSPTTQALVVEILSATNASSVTDKNSPGIGFHISELAWGSLIFNTDGFKFINASATGYSNVTAKALYCTDTITGADGATQLHASGVSVNVVTSGGWARGLWLSAKSSSSSTGVEVQIGAYGSGDTCSYVYLGGTYSSPWAKVTPAGELSANKVYGAVWNDYAEFRWVTKRENEESMPGPGRCVIENGNDSLSTSYERLQPGAKIISDTYGMCMGETEKAKTPIAVCGRVLAYPFERKVAFNTGDPVCSGPNGTVSRMTREEAMMYPERIIDTVVSKPTYKEWGPNKIPVNGRIWIQVK